MSVKSLGERLLGEVEVVGLDELVCDLRHRVPDPPKPNLGIPVLDRLLEIFCAVPPPPVAARWSSPASDAAEEGGNSYEDDESSVYHSTALSSRAPKWKPVVIELTSVTPASGKTNFLYYVTAIAVLSERHGGLDSTVVWVDTDGRFSATRLREVVCGVISAPPSSQDEIEELIHNALTHVHVFQSQSSEELIETLDCLPSYLLDMTAHLSVYRSLGLLVLDSATAWYWQDRLEAEIARYEDLSAPRDRPTRTMETITKLKQVQKEFDCAIAFSTSAPFMAGNKAAQMSEAEDNDEEAAPRELRLINPWTAFANLTLVLSRVEVPRFASHMSIEECLRDREKRQEVVARGCFVAEVDRSGSEMWTAAVKAEWRRLDAGGRFNFRIGTHVKVG